MKNAMPGKKISCRRSADADFAGLFPRFAMAGTLASAQAYGSGHIHETFLLKTSERECPDCILQRVNQRIFKDIPRLMENIVRVTEHLRCKVAAIPGSDPGREVLTVVPTRSGASFHRDGEGEYWRCFRFIDHRESGERPAIPAQALEAGRLFGRFLNLLADLPAPPLHETIPLFHDLDRRLADFHAALDADPLRRKGGAAVEIAFTVEREGGMKQAMARALAGGLPLRVTHNDTKFNNILFDKRGRALCVIDLDTVMPGYVLYDFGDAIRSGCNRAREDEPAPAAAGLDVGLFENYARGFLEALRGGLSGEEISLLAFSARLMTFIIGLRFLSDHLAGDRYFRIDRPGHNLRRARVQFRLLRDMERRAVEMEDIVRALAQPRRE